MAGQEAGAFAPWQEGDSARRSYRRWIVHLRATLRAGRRRRTCIAHDLSPGGAAVTIFRVLDVAVGESVRLVLPGFGAIPAEVRHVDDKRFGLMFTHDDDRAMALARFLVEQPPSRGDRRETVDAPAVLLVRGEPKPCTLSNVSRFGAGIAFDGAASLAVEEEVLLRIDGVGSLQGIVSRVGAHDVGLVLIDEYTGGATRPGGPSG